MTWTGSFVLAIAGGIAIGCLVAVAMERFFLRALEGKMMSQMLCTIGFTFFFRDLCLVIWGGSPQWVKAPAFLTGALNVHSYVFAVYRIFVVVMAIVVALGLWWLQERTRFGIMLRASVDDREMAQCVGIKFHKVSMGAFFLGGGLAALAGVIGSAYLSLFPGIEFELIPYAFVVVILGGLGSLRGVVVGSIVVGLIDNFGKALFPELSYFTLFAPMAIILAVRPTGLFGRTA
jgi:branched-chain amino acid transport system permease protein